MTAAEQQRVAKAPDYNRIGLDFRRSMPRAKVRGAVVDFHCHLHAAGHGCGWFEAADHYGIDFFATMTPLEEALALQRTWGHRLHFIAVPSWQSTSPRWADEWLLRLEAFYNIGSRIAKIHAAPGTISARGWRLDSPQLEPILREIAARRMAVMTHVGDPDTWYATRYIDTAKFGTREEHCQMWQHALDRHGDIPWIGAHLGGNPENLPRIQRLLDQYPNLMLDTSATRWMTREISLRRDEAREFFIRNQDRILFGSDQVSGEGRSFEFLASRWWTHRRLWETAYIGPAPILDPDLPEDNQPTLRGLALPDEVLQKIYHDNAAKLLERLGSEL